ncbi:hypothetical protein PPL_10989 [Heterostelium album PN500]|uniref:GP-PDE domain-containing protein n=1 Tax=Heterostelium pallidum (strain ATCC 26659 / Pp 5 / PN500) TaxID=670386 RepID=D3BSM0_HETP5|nr:hypothetical protein PPL_10989 [Heterostelium album PN500]EFA75485.1 hypothetical protein PPL_10989 [Heterostelium album PN500]|eukprot:XP_020427619.1 hypothetical protein PPL_10989 [Heterostelium album PN500]
MYASTLNGAAINRTLVMAHRGSRYLMPENTILAFKTALDIGTDVLETDVRATKDGHLVVFHDKQIVRTTGLPGEVETLTLAQLQEIDAAAMFSPDNGTTRPFRNKGIRVPLAREMFDALPPATPLNIEIKEDDRNVSQLLWSEIERAFDNGRPHRSIVVSSRFCAPTSHIRELAAQYASKHQLTELPITTSACEKDVVRFLLLAQFFLAKIWYSWFPINNYEVFQIPTASGPMALDTPRVIDAAHYFGKHVHYWVINSPGEIDRIASLGIEGIITDRPDNAVRVLQQRGIKPRSWVIPKPLPGNHTVLQSNTKKKTTRVVKVKRN